MVHVLFVPSPSGNMLLLPVIRQMFHTLPIIRIHLTTIWAVNFSTVVIKDFITTTATILRLSGFRLYKIYHHVSKCL